MLMRAARAAAVQGIATAAAAAGPQVLKVALPIGKQLLTYGAQGLVAGVSAIDAAKKNKRAGAPSDNKSDNSK